MNSEKVLEFVTCINEHDAEKLTLLMTEDHTFTDAHGNSFSGKNTMKEAWMNYFSKFPDYKIEIDEFFESENLYVMLGYASGTYKGLEPEKNRWKLPAAWRASVSGGLVESWQVYCDTKIPFDIIEKYR
jgi:ketosteroid isomerase-like protein